jgi:glycine/D-amino acid oxidase-like deaminating enzyme
MNGVHLAFSVPICSLWPYKFVSQLLAKLIQNGFVNLQTNTPVMSITQEDDRNIIYTNRGEVRAKKVVFATNAYTAGICAKYRDFIIPTKSTATHITPTGGAVSPHLSHTYNISYTPGPRHIDYLNPRPDGGIVVGGGNWIYAPRKELWYNNWDDSTLLPGLKSHFDGMMQRLFRGWHDSGAEVDHI